MTLLTSRHTVTALLFLAFVLRLTAVKISPIGDTLYSDMGNYQVIADKILEGVWLPGHFMQAIGFSLILTIFKRLFTNWTGAFAVYHVVLSTATVWLVWKCATRAFGPRVGVFSLFLAAIHVPWIVLTAVALSETTFTLLLAGLAWASLELVERPSVRWSMTWGLLFISGFWLKGTLVLLGPMFLLGMLARQPSRATLAKVVIPVSAVVGAGLLLHGVLTYRTIGTFRLSAAAGGLNFVEGKCPSKRNIDSTGAGWYSPIYAQLGMTSSKLWDRPFTDSGYFMKEGLKCIGRDPYVLIQSFEGIPFLFVGNFLWPATNSPGAPQARLYELVTGPFLMAGVALWLLARWPWRRQETWGELIVWGLPLAALCLCVYIFKSEVRFRVPFDVWFIPMAFAGWLARVTAGEASPSTGT